MSAHHPFSIADIRKVFVEEITAAGGTLQDAYETDRFLVARAKRPTLIEVEQGDSLQGGVACRACDGGICVNPFIYRLVCKNGAIMAQAQEARRIEASEFATSEELEGAVRCAVRSCCEENVFALQVETIRSARDSSADLAIMLMPFLSRRREVLDLNVIKMIFERFMEGDDRSRYGLMNAITSIARDTRDPDTRWRLEEVGGAVPAHKPPPARPDHTTLVGSLSSAT